MVRRKKSSRWKISGATPSARGSGRRASSVTAGCFPRPKSDLRPRPGVCAPRSGRLNPLTWSPMRRGRNREATDFAVATTAIAMPEHILVMTTHCRQGSEAQRHNRGHCKRHPPWCASCRSAKSFGALRAPVDGPAPGTGLALARNRNDMAAWRGLITAAVSKSTT